MRDKIGAIGIDGFERKHRCIIFELCIDEDMLRKDIIREEQHVISGFGGEAHFQGVVDIFGDRNIIVLCKQRDFPCIIAQYLVICEKDVFERDRCSIRPDKSLIERDRVILVVCGGYRTEIREITDRVLVI